MGGDWNIALDQDLDTFGYTAVNNQNSRNTLKDNMENLKHINQIHKRGPQFSKMTNKAMIKHE